MGCLGLLLLFVFVVNRPKGGSETSSDEATASASANTENEPRDDGKQAKRKAFIDTLIKKRIFIKIEQPTDYPRVYVGPPFYAMTFDKKSNIMNAVLSYYSIANPKAKILILRDGMNGKNIGSYSALGLQLK